MRPLFLRVTQKKNINSNESEEMTATFKKKKGVLRDAGYDPMKIGGEELLFWRNDAKGEYEELSDKVYADIQKGNVRL